MVTWKEVAFTTDVAVLSTQDPHAIGTTASAGTSEDASKHDHVHIIGAGAINNANKFGAGAVDATALASDAVTTVKMLDDAVTSAKIGIAGALNFNGKEAKNFIVHQATIGAPPTAVVGKAFQDSSTKKLYVCTAL
jgi:hypothetical protein